MSMSKLIFEFDEILEPNLGKDHEALASDILGARVRYYAKRHPKISCDMVLTKSSDGTSRLIVKLYAPREPSIKELAFYISLVLLGLSTWIYYF